MFLRGWPPSGDIRWRLLPARVNAQLGFGTYAWHDPTELFLPHDITVLTLHSGHIEEITAFLGTSGFREAGLPDHLTA